MRKNKERINNKGFSLVELIIVIAIMAVLIGVLAPQFIKYVEQSRRSADIQMIDGLMTGMQTVAIEPQVNNEVASITATIASTGITYTATMKTGATVAATVVTGEIAKIIPTTSKFKSSDWGTSVAVTGTVGTDGNVTYAAVHTGGTVTFKAYAPSMNITCTTTP